MELWFVLYRDVFQKSFQGYTVGLARHQNKHSTKNSDGKSGQENLSPLQLVLLLNTRLCKCPPLKPRSHCCPSGPEWCSCFTAFAVAAPATISDLSDSVIYLAGQSILRWFIVRMPQGCELDEIIEQRSQHSFTLWLHERNGTKAVGQSAALIVCLYVFQLNTSRMWKGDCISKENTFTLHLPLLGTSANWMVIHLNVIQLASPWATFMHLPFTCS